MYTHIVGSCFDLRVEAVLVLVPEGRVADEEDVQDDPFKHTYHSYTRRHLCTRVKIKATLLPLAMLDWSSMSSMLNSDKIFSR